MATVGDQVNGALRLIGQLAEGEVPSGETSADALSAFNQMLDSWSIERLSVFTTQDQTFTWTAGNASRTLGASGADFTGVRPVLVDDSTYFIYGSVSYPLQQINREQYSGIALKTVTSTLPQLLFVNMDAPNITMYLYPVPSVSIELHVISVVVLAQPATLATTLVIPPGYLRAFRFNLAIEIASEFGVQVPIHVAAIARKSKASLKAINNPNDVMAMPYALVGRRGSTFNIFSGLPQ